MAVPKKRRSSVMFRTRRNTQKVVSIITHLERCIYCNRIHRRLASAHKNNCAAA